MFDIILDDNEDYHSLLPKKIISVIGLESSGTRFVTSILASAHGIPKYREGSFPGGGKKDGLLVQHFSLPWVSFHNPRLFLVKFVVSNLGNLTA